MRIRLALREEGQWWNAYLARSDTMEGAKLIGSIVIGAAKQNPEVKKSFQVVMQQVVSDAIENVTGEAPDRWNVERAPEAERSGSA